MSNMFENNGYGPTGPADHLSDSRMQEVIEKFLSAPEHPSLSRNAAALHKAYIDKAIKVGGFASGSHLIHFLLGWVITTWKSVRICTHEGSKEEFQKELARLFERYGKEFEFKIIDVGEGEDANAQWTGWESVRESLAGQRDYVGAMKIEVRDKVPGTPSPAQ